MRLLELSWKGFPAWHAHTLTSPRRLTCVRHCRWLAIVLDIAAMVAGLLVALCSCCYSQLSPYVLLTLWLSLWLLLLQLELVRAVASGMSDVRAKADAGDTQVRHMICWCPAADQATLFLGRTGGRPIACAEDACMLCVLLLCAVDCGCG